MPFQLYATEGIQLTRSDLTFTLYFIAPGQRVPGQPVEPTCAIALPPVVAKQLALLLRKHLKEHEARMGVLTLPPDSYQTMGVSPEDWDNWLGGQKP